LLLLLLLLLKVFGGANSESVGTGLERWAVYFNVLTVVVVVVVEGVWRSHQ